MADPTAPSAPHLKAPGKEDVVWALHTFEAENDDELTFEAGEKIVVLERDDQYGDGWFQVSSLRVRVCGEEEGFAWLSDATEEAAGMP